MTATILPLTPDALRDIAISALIAKAAVLARDPRENRDDLFRQVSAVIGEYDLPADEYERAIKLLTEALKI